MDVWVSARVRDVGDERRRKPRGWIGIPSPNLARRWVSCADLRGTHRAGLHGGLEGGHALDFHIAVPGGSGRLERGSVVVAIASASEAAIPNRAVANAHSRSGEMSELGAARGRTRTCPRTEHRRRRRI